MKRILLLFTIAGMMLTACEEENQEKEPADSIQQDTTATIKADTFYLTDENETCLETVRNLARKSEFRPLGGKLSRDSLEYWIESIDESGATIHVFMENEEGRSVTVSWLQLDFANKTLGDITLDPGEPVAIAFDTNLLAPIRKNCRSVSGGEGWHSE